MDEEYEDYLDEAIEIAEKEYDIEKTEIIYNNEHFVQCFDEGTSVKDAVYNLANFCL